MDKKNRVLWFVSFGSLLGATLTSWLAPKVIAWYFEPPVNIGVNCRAATEWSMNKLQTVQAIGLVSGAVFGLVFWYSFRNRNQKNSNLPDVQENL